MSDGLDLFGHLSDDQGYHDEYADDSEYGDDRGEYPDDQDGEPPRKGRRSRRGQPARRERRKLRWIIVLVAVLLIVGGAGFGVLQIAGLGYYPDYSGDGNTDVVVQISDGSTTRDIGNQLQAAGVVASANAFVKAGRNNDAIASVQPGFYELRERMSGDAAVARLADPASRVGGLEIRSGMQLDDTTSVDGKVTKGILSHIAAASCATINGQSTCLSVDQLRQAVQNSSPDQLGVPDWAEQAVSTADPKHRLEGLITPGVYNIKPGETAVQTLQRILAQSDAQLQAAGLSSAAGSGSGFAPYQVLIVASIVERESGTPTDMPKVARVLYNRLAASDPSVNKLSLDSTIDYALDRPAMATPVGWRAQTGPYDTYDIPGLPPTPISSPDGTAIQAAEQPADGPWLYFVVCQKDHSSCFDTTLAGHQQSDRQAQANGVY
ncbi:MAG TPA: endolytic transglycosylase MltG [Pseudonocardiaceae bacterium]|nr:endolytic transglycosylase MltG [Pseudonocardiaceae bacterium]